MILGYAVEVTIAASTLVITGFAFFCIRTLNQVEERLDSLEKKVDGLGEQQHEHELTTTKLVGKVDALAHDHERLESTVNDINQKLNDHLIKGDRDGN